MSTYSDWEKALTGVLKNHFETQAAIDTLMALYRSIHLTQRVMSNRVEEDVRQAALQHLVDFSVALPSNPFWSVYSSQLMPLYTVAVQGMLDAMAYVEDDKQLDDKPSLTDKDQALRAELRTRAVACDHLIDEVAVYALRGDRGGDYHYKNARKLRDELRAIRY